LTPLYRHSLHAILLLAIATGSVGSKAQSNYYRWLDSRGNPIHSDRPPPAGVDYEVVSTESTFTRAVTGEEGAVPLAVEPTVGNEFTPQDSAKSADYKKNPEFCQRAKTNLESLTTSAQVKVRDDQGEERYLTPEEMEVERQKAKAQIDVYCE
jgi:hypothetical protein